MTPPKAKQEQQLEIEQLEKEKKILADINSVECKTFENEIADIAKKIRRIKILKNWCIFICDIFISAAQGIVTICLTALALVFALGKASCADGLL